MWDLLILIAGGIFVTAFIINGVRTRLVGLDLKGLTPISRPVFLAGKAAMGILWIMAIWRAAAGLMGITSPTSWTTPVGAVLFAAGCGVALTSLSVLGRESRFGLPDGECHLKTNGIYRWSRNPMYAGFFLMAAGSCLFVCTIFGAVCFVLTLGVHHRVVLAEERFMDQRFGPDWTAYADRVPRYGGFSHLPKPGRPNQ